MEVNGYTIEPGANLQGANLTGANLEGANLFGANLSIANLTGATRRSAIQPALSHRDRVPPRSQRKVFHRSSPVPPERPLWLGNHLVPNMSPLHGSLAPWCHGVVPKEPPEGRQQALLNTVRRIPGPTHQPSGRVSLLVEWLDPEFFGA